MVVKVARMRKAAKVRAEAMGRRAGEALRDLGQPTANPFGGIGPLARAWAHGYMAGLNGPR